MAKRRRERGWTILSRSFGCYYNSFAATRKDAIRAHTDQLGEEWKQRYDKGDRAVKAVLSYDGGNAR